MHFYLTTFSLPYLSFTPYLITFSLPYLSFTPYLITSSLPISPTNLSKQIILKLQKLGNREPRSPPQYDT